MNELETKQMYEAIVVMSTEDLGTLLAARHLVQKWIDAVDSGDTILTGARAGKEICEGQAVLSKLDLLIDHLQEEL